MSQNDSGQPLTAAIFPIEGVVFFPSLTLPLNIFEPRYLLMINDCLETGRPLAVTDLEPAPGVVAGVGQVQLFEKRSDGTLVILVRGLHRARILRIEQQTPYFTGILSPLEEATTVADEHRFFLQRLKSGMLEWADQALADADSRQAFMQGLTEGPDATRRLIETYAHFKISDCDVRQQLLETDTLESRLELLRRLI
ncbi:MAG: LON peptidase substrate-binding domain-containing protein [Oligoflexia bacterium]